MKIITQLFLILILLGGKQVAMAHAVWIESKASASKNQPHDVKIFYGEYASGEKESTDKWYSDLKNLEVWLTTPDNQRVKLDVKDEQEHLSTSFVPEKDGVYYISTVHATKDLGGTTKYNFSSLVPVRVGKLAISATSPKDLPFSVEKITTSGKKKSEIEVLVSSNGKAVKDAEVIVMSETGWTKTLKTNENGVVSFSPQWKGNYVVEASQMNEETGRWNDKDYTRNWHGTTTFFEHK
ncbi:DUF4198 domain-containing protein [Sphingobacterium spiritivorum]|uniref:DUF4198 domain-containing protein n=1 Tax=Sphingobacterium spiritivorum TaxID=258 RepID=UPI003DA6AEA6